MIVFDLICINKHVFEGWFENSESFAEQKGRGLLACPICGSKEVDRILSPISITRNRQQDTSPDKQAVPPPNQKLIRFIEDNFENVGSNFAKEALKIHYGASEPRNIRGVSTEREEKLLREEGVSFFKIQSRPETLPDDD